MSEIRKQFEGLAKTAKEANAQTTALVMELKDIEGYYFKMVCIRGSMPKEEDEKE